MKSGFCVLWGRPNAGKSTLLNALLGRKHVIVSPRPQTTRHRIAGVLHGDQSAGEDYQIVFLDTPGIHQPQHKLGEALVKSARSALADIESIIFVGDVSDFPHADDKSAAQMLEKMSVPVVLALNKIDALSDFETLQAHRAQFEALRSFDAIVEISALQEQGIEALKHEIIARLPDGDPYFPPDMLGDRSPEFHIEELVREQAMSQLREEIPHSVAVGIEQMEPRKNGTLYIEAFLYIERDSQKRIVIGQGGARIREIGQKARVEIETLLGRSVYLELRVKVREKWRDNEMWIQRLGYSE
jgi:GTP-binding protein Era